MVSVIAISLLLNGDLIFFLGKPPLSDRSAAPATAISQKPMAKIGSLLNACPLNYCRYTFASGP